MSYRNAIKANEAILIIKKRYPESDKQLHNLLPLLWIASHISWLLYTATSTETSLDVKYYVID